MVQASYLIIIGSLRAEGEARTVGYESLESVAALRDLHAAIGEQLDVLLDDARTPEEASQGAMFLLRVLAMSTEVVADSNPRAPHFARMDTPGRKVGGDNPDAEYDSVRLDGRHRYRITGNAGSVAHFSMTFNAGGSGRRRTFDYRNESTIGLDKHGDYTLILSATEPTESGTWIQTPNGLYSILVRQFIGDRGRETLATYDIEVLDDAVTLARQAYTDDEIAERIRAATSGFQVMTTLHRLVHPELFDEPHVFVSNNSDDFGADISGTDNLYMFATYDLADDEALIIDLRPLEVSYWNIAVMTRFHETVDYLTRRMSRTMANVVVEPDGSIRLVLTHGRDVHPNWLDTAGQRHGVLIFRWVGPRDAVTDMPTTRVVNVAELET
jgi:hypothetical protein